MKAMAIVLGVFLLSGFQQAHAVDVNGECGTGKEVNWHRNPVLHWPCFEEKDPGGFVPSTQIACKQLAEAVKAPLTCKIDHASYDKHFAAEAKKPKLDDRDHSTPDSDCAYAIGVMLGSNAGTEGISSYFSNEEALAKEFNKLVKSIVCVWDINRAHSMTIDKGVMTIYWAMQKSTLGHTNWAQAGYMKYAPQFKKAWTEKH
jgi:hypothetical protein